MRILHTSDWHLGKIFHGFSLVDDQKFALNQILEALENAEKEKNPFSALVVSGDIYDRAVPPAEASSLLSGFLTETSEKFPYLHIFMISGNHDSAARLSFAASFLEKHKIHLATDTRNFTECVLVEKKDEKSGAAEIVAFYQLPFLQPLSIKPAGEENPEKECRGQEELFREACFQIIEHHKKSLDGIPSVLNAHLFTLGSACGSSERSCIGNTEQVGSGIFKDFSYGAFGHIHKFQPCGQNRSCYYPGALLAYSFDDNPETGMLDVEIEPSGKVHVQRILFKPLHRIAKIEGKFSDFADSQRNAEVVKNHKNDFLQIVLDDETEPSEPFARLKQIFPNLLLLSFKKHEENSSGISIQKRKKAINSNDFGQIFDQFWSDIYGNQNPDGGKPELVEAEKALFKKEADEMEKEKSS